MSSPEQPTPTAPAEGIIHPETTMGAVSLTVAEVTGDRFAVALIPETLERTTLGTATPGDRVNIEVDVLAKHVEKLLEGARA